MLSKLSKSALLEMSVHVYALRVEGLTDDQICDRLRITYDDLREALKHMYETRAEQLRQTPREHMYIDYCTEQRRNIHDLNQLIKKLDEAKQSNAYVGAIRLRSEITDKIIEKGQEFGVIKKTPQRTEVVAGILVADMTQEDLRKGIIEQSKLLKDVLEKYGDGDITTLKDGPTHFLGTSIVTEGTTVLKRESARPPAPDDDDDEELVSRMTAKRVPRPAKSGKSNHAKRSAGRYRARE